MPPWATLDLESALGARNALLPWIHFHGHPQGPCCALEDRFANVVRIPAVVNVHVQVAECIRRHRLPEVFNQLAVEVANLRARHWSIEDEEIPSGEIDGRGAECFLHRQGKVAISADSLLIAEGVPDGLTEANADIFHRVVGVDVQVPLGLHRKIEATVAGKQFQHVVEEADPRAEIHDARTIEVEFQVNLCFSRTAVDRGGSGHVDFQMRSDHRSQQLQQDVDLLVGTDADPQAVLPARIIHVSNQHLLGFELFV
jgi:hypothetical protein